MLGLRLRYLSFHGPNRDPAVIEFEPGLNVIYGASDTENHSSSKHSTSCSAAKDRCGI